MDNLDARSVFFVRDAERSLRFYTQTLGFSLDWNHQEQSRAFVFQVSLLGFQLILNQSEPWTDDRPLPEGDISSFASSKASAEA